MTPDDQRIAIATHLGWRCERLLTDPPQYTGLGMPPGACDGDLQIQELPDYLGDLNAMNEAEKTLTDAQYDKFIPALHFVWSGVEIGRRPMAMRQTVQATAAQRAEAFLRTLNLWTE